jgi:ketosteroid isomerase-like protein
MSEENVEIVQRGYDAFLTTGALGGDIAGPDFVWDMTHFHGWPEQRFYEGVAGTERFLADWVSAWDDWALEVEELRDAGDKVVALVHQRGRSKATGIAIDMTFAQVFTVREGKQTRMEMYSDVSEALAATGLA